MTKIKMRKKSLVKIEESYLHPDYGIIFMTKNKKKYAYHYGIDASGAIVEITIEEIK